MDPPEPQPQPIGYVCGRIECGAETKLKPGDAIKCGVCRYRILYKKRTQRTEKYDTR